jgi:hypothetical protein
VARSVGSLLQASAFNLILNPLYLRRSEELPLNSPLRDPRRQWAWVARRRLDETLANVLGGGSADYRAAKHVLGNHSTFAAKAEAFFDDAGADLRILAGKGVSPNLFGAAMVFIAWDWRITDRSMLHELLASASRAERWWHTLSEAGDILEKLRPLALAMVLGKRAGSQWKTRSIPRVDSNQTVGPDVASELEEVIATSRRLEEKLLRGWKALRRDASLGRSPDVKFTPLIRFLATVVKVRTGDKRFERLARLLHAADLPLTREKMFDRDAVRKRYHSVDGTAFAGDLDRLVKTAYRQLRQEAARLGKA